MFEWDPFKAQSNLQKHGVSFEEATEVFDDALAMHRYDFLHSIHEDRFIAIGESSFSRLLIISYTVRDDIDGEIKIRIISARKANKQEIKSYNAR
jgi:uncharacterized DUF497 family protein